MNSKYAPLSRRLRPVLSLLLVQGVLTAQAIEPLDNTLAPEAPAPGTEENSERTLHGDLVSLLDGQLHTSVGSFTLDTPSQVDDRRTEPDRPARVTITLQGDRPLSIVIYQ